MTPGARIAAAIAVLDEVLSGAPAEKVLTTWARRNRYAGSGDRAAIRDHVYDALRCRRSFAWLGGAETGRGLMLGAQRASGTDPSSLFTGEGYAPAPVGAEEAGQDLSNAPDAVRLDMPDWLMGPLSDSLGDRTEPALAVLRTRAPVFLRVNIARADREDVRAMLAADGIETAPHPLADTALEVTSNPRRVAQSRAYLDGLVELQDASSQAACAAVPLEPGARVLDYCAGGGGKALALAARGARVTAHDSDPRRMRDLPVRAERAGAAIVTEETIADADRFDVVLCDVPCTGSGTWRRTPEAKWLLTPERLDDLCRTQAEILATAARHVKPGGTLVYMTCSMLTAENSAQIEEFLAASKGWTLTLSRRFSPEDGGDGFFVAVMDAPST
ncbi:RsmB/NOP family class I SAM-dependent RNA methyltransferase [Psychromarinibacter halotolerans]|uniref:RsmB/NOP family class I SAM-dependent RNA methyltransferase n=1 Tax=Psychromarinibacter halotolerans TaxID=1775175 RepID=A0ABV7GVZ3_9RHOB|nr:RsmB/NOP family class I SAM-dependent RNA methyltransferase [Psychromarinibacter halotolerans]MDF0595012.1 RsmB/NOP family class I SAM-dependent RNA methyltransferase [Psychromarinibacter halotolerans]